MPKDRFTIEEMALIRAIDSRFVCVANEAGVEDAGPGTATALITACNVQLDLDRLAAFPNGSFGHDLFGIMKYIDGDGNLRDHFLPRCATPSNRRDGQWPEHEKIDEVEHRVVSGFAEFIDGRESHSIVKHLPEGGIAPMTGIDIGELIAEYLGVNPEAFEAEKDQMLPDIREQQNEVAGATRPTR